MLRFRLASCHQIEQHRNSIAEQSESSVLWDNVATLVEAIARVVFHAQVYLSLSSVHEFGLRHVKIQYPESSAKSLRDSFRALLNQDLSFGDIAYILFE
jgi:hypothetical protein